MAFPKMAIIHHSRKSSREFTAPVSAPSQRPSARLREEGGRQEVEGIFTAGHTAGGAEEGLKKEQREQERPLSPSILLKTSLLSITSD